MKLPPEHVAGVGLKRATAYGGLGERLLKQCGWKEGEGLGSQGTGIKTAVKVLKKDDNIGVGGRQLVREDATSNWWQQSFDAALDNIREAASGTDSSDSDADDFDIGSGGLHRDGTIASSSAAELHLAQELAKDPWGRFGGRNGKMARIRAQEAAMAAAQQGSSPVPQEIAMAEADVRPRKRQKKESSINNSSKDDPQLPSTDLKASKKRKGRKREAQVDEAETSIHSQGEVKPLGKSEESPKVEHALSLEARKQQKRRKKPKGDSTKTTLHSQCPQTSMPRNWWGASVFVAAGCLGGLNDVETSATRKSFTEDTQEDLYTRTHAAKTAGKKGLGSGQGKSLGHEWQGTKTVLGDSDTEPQPSQPSQGLEQLPRKRLERLAKQILKQEEGQKLKLSRLTKRMAKECGDVACPLKLQALIAETVGACKRMEVKGKTVHLLPRC